MCERQRGLGQALLASFLISVCSVVVKSCQVPIGQATFLSGLVVACCSFPVALYRSEDLFPSGHRLRLLLFSVLNSIMVLSDYQAMRLMPLGDEAVMAYTSIIFTVLLARIFLGEPCSREKLLCSFCIVVGVALISSPAVANLAYPHYGLGCVLTLLGALCDASSYIFIKELSAVPCSVILISCGTASMIITGPLSLIEEWTIPKELISLTTITLLTFFHDLFIILALRAEEAGLVSLVQATDIVFSYIWELTFFEEPYTFLRVFGAGLVISAVCLAALVERSPPVSLLECKELPVFIKQTDRKLRYEFGLRAEMFKWLHLRDR
ncbi:unnamed protein product [Nezara viridula]|nr:unnamed protein product [Nezara viridula]